MEITAEYQHFFDTLDHRERLALYERAAELFSDNKRQLFDRLAAQRTRHVTVVLEDVYQSHNASAVLRSCDCFGVQDVHVVENRNRYCPNPDVAMGSNKWVDIYKRSSILDTYDALRAKGYRIVATLPHENDTMIGDLDVSQPTALVFGTELTGLTQEAIDHADAYVKVPMYGFTESFNISVCAALSLYALTERMRRSNIQWQLTDEDQTTLKLYWAMQVIHDGPNVMKHIMNQR
ncbi:MAG: RNA methyltransferase [Bacteroidales bacterium]|nr:RNA methyltransferase [Candidatus Colimorpha onthohippi]